MKMYIQPNELSHNKGLILVVILFDTFFLLVKIITNIATYCKMLFFGCPNPTQKTQYMSYLRWPCESTCIFRARINAKVRISTQQL